MHDHGKGGGGGGGELLPSIANNKKTSMSEIAFCGILDIWRARNMLFLVSISASGNVKSVRFSTVYSRLARARIALANVKHLELFSPKATSC